MFFVNPNYNINMEYIRSPHCECAQYSDIDSVSFEKRKSLKFYWQKGYIYTQGKTTECSCHKRFRLGSRYDILSLQFGLPSYQDLSQLKYMGPGDAYKKLKAVPAIVDKHPIRDLIVYCTGIEGNQKTTSAAKVIYDIVTSNKTVEYILFPDLINKMLSFEFDQTPYLTTDFLFIDDVFEGETVNFKNTYNAFYNLLLKRRKPTILISSWNQEMLFSDKGKQLPSFNPDMLNKIFNRINNKAHKSVIEFNDNVEKLRVMEQIGDEPVDLWSL